MKRLILAGLSVLTLTSTSFLLPSPSFAQFPNIKPHLNQLPSTRIRFNPGSNSSSIQNAVNEVYIFRARAGQYLTIKANSLGASASVTLYGVEGQPLAPSLVGSTGEGKVIRVRLRRTGDYYIAGGSGLSNAAYDFTLTIR